MLRKLEKCFSCEEILDKQIAEESLMDNFPIDNIEDLEKFEKSLKDNIINRKELVNILKNFIKCMYKIIFLIVKSIKTNFSKCLCFYSY